MKLFDLLNVIGKYQRVEITDYSGDDYVILFRGCLCEFLEDNNFFKYLNYYIFSSVDIEMFLDDDITGEVSIPYFIIGIKKEVNL